MSNSDISDIEASPGVPDPGPAPHSELSPEADFLITRLLQQGIPTAPGLTLSQLRELSDQASSAPQPGVAAPASSPERQGEDAAAEAKGAGNRATVPAETHHSERVVGCPSRPHSGAALISFGPEEVPSLRQPGKQPLSYEVPETLRLSVGGYSKHQKAGVSRLRLSQVLLSVLPSRS